MKKQVSQIFAFALLACSAAFAQDRIELDIIIRHFQVSDQDLGFEMFDSDLWGSGVCAGSNPAATSQGKTIDNQSNQICFQGNRYMYCNEGGTPLKYGQDNCDNNIGRRGYTNGPDQTINNPCWQNDVYVTRGMVQNQLHYDIANCSPENIVGEDGDPDHIRYRYCARPRLGNGGCNGQHVETWFSDTHRSKRVNDIIELNRQNDGTYLIEYDYNTRVDWACYGAGTSPCQGRGTDGGFFPLDKFQNPSHPAYNPDATWGLQSLNIWCPRTDHGYDLGADCRAWRNNGGPQNPNAAQATVNQNPNLRSKLHSYAFSLAGTGEFKYTGANDVFEFIGDDDMWIFIDGELVADLGGTHLAAPAKINIREYAEQRDWELGSKHAVNFFFLDRQTDGMNFKLKMSLSDLAASRFGAPRIVKAETEIDSEGKGETLLYVSSRLDENILNWYINELQGQQFPIIVHKGDPHAQDKDSNIYGYRLESIEWRASVPEGHRYFITGVVCVNASCTETTALNSGDYLSFNVLVGDLADRGFTSNGFAIPGNDFYIKNVNGIAATQPAWGRNTSNIERPPFEPKVVDPNPVKPPFVFQTGGNSQGSTSGRDDRDPTVPGGSGGTPVGSLPAGGNISGIDHVWDPNTGSMVPITSVPGAKDNADIHGFGTVGNQIPPQRAGELILTTFPPNTQGSAQETERIVGDKLFGIPPEARGGDEWWGVVDPTQRGKLSNGVTEGGYSFVKNGFPNESNVKGNIKLSPSRCTSDLSDPDKPRINCLNFSMVASQPFQLAVTIYDQLGNFVTQYRETVTEQEFRNVTQAANYNPPGAAGITPTSECLAPTLDNYGAPNTLTTDGRVMVNVNIYPFSANGRRFGNGVYIVKIDRVDLPFKSGSVCNSVNGIPLLAEPTFIRYHAEKRFGWMRSNSKE
ncbi:MAG: fibro-slime domain-containing protein [Fibromonadaceae bacterium]|jgi:fibro-slime domain-containing protein|nr:fibro-slime domain-containing protein [Fibromonadaceae bacterium]